MRVISLSPLLAAACMLAAPAYAVSTQEAQAVAAALAKLSRPSEDSTEFAAWAYGMAFAMSYSCWQAATPGQPLPEVLKQVTPKYATGYRLPGEAVNERQCAHLAKQGFSPHCTSARLIAKNGRWERGYPPNHLQFGELWTVPRVHAELSCRLALGAPAQLTYTTPLRGFWAMAPQASMMQVGQQEKLVNKGSLVLEAPGVVDAAGRPFRVTALAVVH